MTDPTKVYGGSIPMGGFDAEQAGAGFSTVNEAESGAVPGKGDAPSPKVVNQGGPTPQKTYDKTASQDFLLNSSYKTDMEFAPRPTKMDIDNPDDLSHADHCDDEDIASKGY